MAIGVTVQDTTLRSIGTSITFDVSGITAGNLLLCVIVKDDDIATTDPTGNFTKLIGFESLNSIWLDVWYKEAVSADESATSYSFDGEVTDESYSGIFYELSGVDTTPVSLTTAIGDDDTPATTSQTASATTSLIIAGFGNDFKVTGQAVSATITTEDVADSGIANGDVGIAFGHYEPGSTTIPAYTHGTLSAVEQWAAFVVEVKIAAGGGSDDLLAEDVESASEVSSPDIAQKHVILADNVESDSEVSSPAVAQDQALLADNVESASEVSAPTLSESHALLADNVESDSEVSSPAISQIHAVLADDVESNSEVSSPAIAQAQVLLADNIESGSEVSSPAVAQVQTLLADNVESESDVSDPALTENTGDALLAENVESDSEVSSPALSLNPIVYGSYDKTNIIRQEVFGLTVLSESFGTTIAAEQTGFTVGAEVMGFDAVKTITGGDEAAAYFLFDDGDAIEFDNGELIDVG